jgi:hypothetical protein
VLIITDQSTVRVGWQGSLAGARKAKENCNISILPLIGRGVQSENVVLDRHLIKENSENTLLHLSGVLGTENNHLLLGEVDGNRGSGSHTFGVSVGREGPGIVNGIIGMEVLEIFSIRSNKHISHEESMIGASADNPDSDSVLLVPSCKPINNVDPISGVQVVNCSLAVNSPDLFRKMISKRRLIVWEAIAGKADTWWSSGVLHVEVKLWHNSASSRPLDENAGLRKENNRSVTLTLKIELRGKGKISCNCVGTIVYIDVKIEDHWVWNAIAIQKKERQQSWGLRLRPVHDHGNMKSWGIGVLHRVSSACWQVCEQSDFWFQKANTVENGYAYPHQISFSELGSLTIRLSRGERPVFAPEYAVRAPVDVMAEPVS